MIIHLNIAHYWKPEQQCGIVALSKETNLLISQRILEAARELAAYPQVFQENIK